MINIFVLIFGIITINLFSLMSNLTTETKKMLETALTGHGLRATRQREQVFAVILEQRDHPSADDVYARVKDSMPTISLATVYNCLESLVACGLIRQVNFERESTRFCPNLSDHAHFFDTRSNKVYDINLPVTMIDELRKLLPEGLEAETVEVSFRGNYNQPHNHPQS